MSNVLDALMPKILAQGLMALRGFTVMPRLVNTDFSNEAKLKGNTIDVPIPGAIACVDVVPGIVPPANTDAKWTTVPVPLDQWKEAPFYLTDKEVGQILTGMALPLQASEAIKSIAQTVNGYIFSQMYQGIPYAVGTAGTAPFATDISAATAVRKQLNKTLAPLTDRHAVLDVDAAANALGLAAFNNNLASQDKNVITEGELGRKLGFNWHEDQQVPVHPTAAVGAGAITVNGVNALGASIISMAKGAGVAMGALKGDIFTIAGDSTQYVVTAPVAIAAGGNTNISCYPPLKKATVGAEAITFVEAHVVNLAFNRFAFAFATRPLQDPLVNEGLGGRTLSAVDPVTGLALRLEVTRQHKQTRFSYDILYGGQLIRADLGTRLLG